ncbi:type VII toxin-antitoxin system MntA family adenylyltransferase antitoxin [Zhaonella formicivorans]|uniref:type VII toxin-antitoxin system MntA family adenylyltransferase antitoxin n=1 Tax=Zhaonella formicivorans TaxID=2528593 RepID=UPI0010D7C52D|nr:nucleotidyltransferase domain-containing protein [Zhaonella formicivorans]
MTKKLELDEKLQNLPAFFSEIPAVLAVFLFGSYGTEKQTVLSDIDFAVFFNKNIGLSEEMAILAKLSAFLGTDRVDLVNLNKAPLSIQFRAIVEGKIIYEKDYIATCDYIEKVIGQYQDYAIDLHCFYEEYDQAVKEAYTDG